uniref:HIVEP zinc finger 1 n=1 Tax=Cyprinodon variegatus TaxID=28743 RepID=A0A3Q2FCQ9_CYPVA
MCDFKRCLKILEILLEIFFGKPKDEMMHFLSVSTGIAENSRGAVDSIKGLKRKKVIAENQLKKNPKSPVKKPLKSKICAAAVSDSSPRKTTPSSLPIRPTNDSSTSQPIKEDPEDVLQTAASLEEGKETSQVNAEELLAKDSKSPEHSFVGESYRSSDPLDALLKAMEPDFSKLTERKSPSQANAINKPPAALHPQLRREVTPLPAVNIGLQTQPPQMQTYYIDKQGNVIGIAAAPHGNLQTSQQGAAPLAAPQFVPVVSSSEMSGLHMNFSSGPPAPMGTNALPQSQPPVAQTCQSVPANVPCTVQVPVTPAGNQMQMTTVMNFGAEQVAKDQKLKKPGKYVCEYCNRACAKPSVLLKHIRSHTGERPYPCVTCGFSFKTKSNLYKHKKSHAHAIKLGLMARSESGGGSLSQESDKAASTHSEAEESGDSDEEGSTADLDPDATPSCTAASSETSLQGTGITSAEPNFLVKSSPSQKAYEPKVTAALPKVVVYPVNVSPLRADSPRVTGAAPEQAAVQRQREFQATNLRSGLLSSLKEVEGTNLSLDTVSEDEDQQCKSPLLAGHAQLQRQQATDFSQQQQQPKCLLSPRSLGSTDSGYFSRSESADQAMSPTSPFVKITPPVDPDITKNTPPSIPSLPTTVMHVAAEQKSRPTERQMRPPLEASARSLEERISKLISDNEAVVDNKQLDSVKPRRTSLSRRGSIDSPKSYIFKDSFQFDLKPIGRRSSSSSDIPKSPFTPTDKSKPVFLLSVPSPYPPMDCLPITRSNSMPTTPGHSALPVNVAPIPHPLRGCQSFDDKIGSLNDEVFSSAPPTPNPAIHSRTLVRQVAVEDFSTSEGHCLPSVRSMDEGYHGPSISADLMQRSKSFEHGQDKNKKPQQNKGTMYECETCRNRYRKLENFETHRKFYCSELRAPKNKPVAVKESDQDVFHVNVQHPTILRSAINPGILDHQTSFRKRRIMKSVGDEDDQSPTDTIPPCSVSFESPIDPTNRTLPRHTQIVDIQLKNNQSKLPQIQLVARGMNTDSRLSPIRENQNHSSMKGELQRQGSGTSVIKHTNSLTSHSSFETDSIDRVSPVIAINKDSLNEAKTDGTTAGSSNTYHEKIAPSSSTGFGNQIKEPSGDGRLSINSTPVHQSRLVRQSNIQVPEILVTEDSDREHETQAAEPADKPPDQFNWPQRSESLSKLPAEKLPPKKKRIRLAQMDHSSGESSFESTLSRSLSRDSSLSRCSSISASFDRDELSRSESPSRADNSGKVPDTQSLSAAFNTLGVPGMMRRAASEQITCTQPSVEISCDYRSKSFDCGNVSPSRSLSPVGQPKTGQLSQVPLIERRRGPLVRQMSLKIGPESQLPVLKSAVPSITNVSSFPQNKSQQIHISSRRPAAQPFVLHPADAPLQKNEQMVQSINLGSPTQQPQVHGLPHPWHQASRVKVTQKIQQPLHQISVGRETVQNKPVIIEEKKCFIPKYQLQCSLRTNQTFSFSCTQGAQIALPIFTIPITNPMLSVPKFSDAVSNVFVASHQASEVKTQTIVSNEEQTNTQNQQGPVPLPQILITHEQMNPSSSLSKKNSMSSSQSVEGNPPVVLVAKTTPLPDPDQVPSICMQKLASVTLCPQQEPIASSKRMLSPANSLDIYMEKHQKRAKDEHGVACLTDGRSLSYLNSKMSEVTRQRKLMLVRQVCTTEPADSPIETEAPPLPDVKTDSEKDTEATDDVKPMSPDGSGLDKDKGSVNAEEVVLTATPGSQDTTITTSALKPQEKIDEHRWSPAKSLIRPASFHSGQGRLTTSVSVVNTKDTHRLSFPSLKTTTTFTWCYLMKRKPLHVQQANQKTSAYASWSVSPNNPNPLGLPTKVVISLFDSKQSSKKIHYTSAIKTSGKSDTLSYSGKLKDIMPKVITQKSVSAETRGKLQPEPQTSNDSEKEVAPSTEPRRIKIFDGGYKSNEEYVYVRGRGRGKYICEECGIRCKKPSMLRKHIRTHSDVRPYHCVHCNFSFKTKGNLTKHMKSKAHSKKCMEMGVPAGVVEDQDAEDSGMNHMSSTDRQDSDGDDSDGPDDEENDDEEEEDSQAESGLSTNPSVSASPQHFSLKEADIPPSALLAQMSISSVSLPLNPPESSASDSVPVASPASPRRQPSGSRCSPAPLPPITTITSDCYTSDPESVHMMSPVSPCRQMSIDYPDFDVPISASILGQTSKAVQVRPTGESGTPVDRGTQTSYAPQLPLQAAPPPAGAETHLFSHLPLHSQQPTRSPYSMVPVGGIQLVPAGMTAFVPIQTGPVQLTIPAVGVIHRNSSPLPPATSPPHPENLQTQPPISSVVPCFPLGQVTGLQAQTIQPVGLETLNLMGLTNTQLTLNAALGLQVLTPNQGPQSGSQNAVPGLQIVNIALPAIIPSLSPLSALSPLQGSSDWQGSAEPPRTEHGGTAAGGAAGPAQTVEKEEGKKSPLQLPAAPWRQEPPPADPAPRPTATSRQTLIDEYNEASSDDEDRLVIAT